MASGVGFHSAGKLWSTEVRDEGARATGSKNQPLAYLVSAGVTKRAARNRARQQADGSQGRK